MRQVSTFVFALETAQKHCCLKDETQTDLKVFQFGKTIFSTNSEGVAVKNFKYSGVWGRYCQGTILRIEIQ